MKIKNLLDEDKQAPTLNQPTEYLPNTNSIRQTPIQIFQPWANMIVKIKIPDDMFKVLLNMYDETMKDWKSFGQQLVGQVEEEPEVSEEIRNKFPEWLQFCQSVIIEYVKTATMQNLASEQEQMNSFLKEQIFARISTMWFVNQKPGEYNPAHIHTNCKVSSVCYLKTPKQQIKDRKPHYKSDGKITFTNNTGTDLSFANATCSFEPVAGDMYIFGAIQHHMVWPYRSADPNDGRISLSFNADFRTSSQLEHEKKQHEMMYESMKKMKESENDKSITDGDINKSG